MPLKSEFERTAPVGSSPGGGGGASSPKRDFSYLPTMVPSSFPAYMAEQKETTSLVPQFGEQQGACVSYDAKGENRTSVFLFEIDMLSAELEALIRPH